MYYDLDRIAVLKNQEALHQKANLNEIKCHKNYYTTLLIVKD